MTNESPAHRNSNCRKEHTKRQLESVWVIFVPHLYTLPRYHREWHLSSFSTPYNFVMHVKYVFKILTSLELGV